jgi:hypothetical protein
MLPIVFFYSLPNIERKKTWRFEFFFMCYSWCKILENVHLIDNLFNFKDRCYQPTHQTLNYLVKWHNLYRGTMYNDICCRVSIPVLIESVTILIERIPMFIWCILILIELSLCLLGVFRYLLEVSLFLLTMYIYLLTVSSRCLDTWKTSIHFLSWTATRINYHVVVGQYELSGSKLLCAIFDFDFSAFVYFP